MSSSLQEQRLLEFREAIKDVLLPEYEDQYLLRWLRARNFVVHDAEQMFRAHLEWRKQMGVDKLVNEWQPPEVLTKYFPGGLFGYDKDGCPIWIEPIGLADVQGIARACKSSDIMRFKTVHCEQIENEFRSQSQKLGKRIHGLTIILDLDKYGLKHLWKPALDNYSRVLAMYADNYPENLKKCYVIRAPKIFPIAYAIMKPFLSEDTRRKIQVLGGNWREQLLRYIDADQLPKYWGGTAVDPDGNEYCKSKICIGGEVPRSMYLTSAHDFETLGFHSLVVERKLTKRVEVNVPVAGCMLRWQFLTEHHNISFSVERRPPPTGPAGEQKNAEETVVPLQRINCHIVPEDGCITCDKAGTWSVNIRWFGCQCALCADLLSFDNSYSWLRAKKILYQVEVITPDNLADLSTTATCTSSATNS